MRGHVVGFLLNLVAGVGHGDGESAVPHHRQVDHIVSHKPSFARRQALLAQDFFKNRQPVLNALVHMLELQIVGAQRDRFRNSLGNEASLDATKSG